MAKSIETLQLPHRLQQLLQERERLAEALAHVDQVLAGIGAALGTATVREANVKRPNPAVVATLAPAQRHKGRRPQRKFATSGEQSLLDFVKLNKNPSTQDIKKHWHNEGRGGRADTVLSKLVKEKRLKRTPLETGLVGSRYSLK